MTKHDWREREEDGVRIYRALFHGNRWALRSKLKNDEDWTDHEPMTKPDLTMLRDVLWRKYQRQRVPYKHVVQIDKMLEDLEEG